MVDNINILGELIELGKKVEGLSVHVENSGKKIETLFTFHNDHAINQSELIMDIRTKMDNITCPRNKEIDETIREIDKTIKLIEEQGKEIRNITLKKPWREDLIKNIKLGIVFISGTLGIIWALKKIQWW